MAREGKRHTAESAQLAAMARRAKQLGGTHELAGEVAERIRKEAEGRLGYRCGGCGERIGVGLKFRRIDVVLGAGGKPQVDVLELAACNGASGCDYAEQCREGADLVEMVEFVWLRGDAPVAAGELDSDVQTAEGQLRARAAEGEPE